MKTVKCLKIFMVIWVIFYPHLSSAVKGKWKFRAREHFEIHKVKFQGVSSKFKGFSNTINFWYEKPWKYSIGFAFSPLLATAKSDKGSTLNYGERIRLYNVGVEGKYFFIENFKGVFTRAGVGFARLENKGALGDLNGYNLYIGLGYEFGVSKTFTLAPEVAFRQSYLAENVDTSTLTSSVGVHFYKRF